MDPAAIIAIVAFGLGSLFAVGAPLTFILRNKVRWNRAAGGTRWTGPCPGGGPALEAALRTFLDAWASTFGFAKRKTIQVALAELRVAFVAGDSFKDASGDEYRGLTTSKTSIVVAARARSLSHTAFVHELIHAMLWNLNGTGDADHEDAVYKGWTAEHTQLERDVNKALALAEAPARMIDAAALETPRGACGSCSRDALS